jgi:2-polyprenyl-3-methyl-5-hydroxy-6-metoxy-1,4-benzoquinol methylase
MVGPTDYDTIASRYAAGVDEQPCNALYERPATLALLTDVGGRDVLDAGCGPGWYTDWLARNGARVVAIDCSPAWSGWLTNDARAGARDARCGQAAKSASKRNV